MQTILVAIDFSETTAAVIAVGARLATAFGSRLYLVHVVPPDPDFVGYEAGPQTVRDAVAAQSRSQHQELQRLEEGLRSDGVVTTALLIQGATVERLLAEQGRLAADAIVLGSHGHGALYDLLVGSVAEGVLRRAPCPVVVVPSRPA